MFKSNKPFPWRHLVQVIFALIVLYIGIKFILFVRYISHPNAVPVSRPAGVEAFLPISALVALKAWLATGIFDRIHPAGLVLFLAAITVSVLLKRAFCSWICPIGTLAEGLAILGRKMFGKNFVIPKWFDYPLRSLKYLLLTFFLVVIPFGMSGSEAYAFLQTPYNMIADVKMLMFFQNLSAVGISVLAVLVILSLVVQHFWCRYLCPYGALLGVLSILSPWKITRNQEACLSCGQCTKVCPNQIKVDRSLRVWSAECTGCLSCTTECPMKGTLRFELPKIHAFASPASLAVTVLVLWILFVGIAKLTGHWETSISLDMYKALIPLADKLSHY